MNRQNQVAKTGRWIRATLMRGKRRSGPRCHHRVDPRSDAAATVTRPGDDATESTPVWAEAVSCMTAAGAPPDLLDQAAAREQRHIDEGGDPMGGHGFDVFLYEWVSDDSGPHPDDTDYVVPEEAKAFVRCVRPFFAEVERVLAGPRAAFVEEHREELLELQRQFEALDVEGD
jgi:hypothetical protein